MEAEEGKVGENGEAEADPAELLQNWTIKKWVSKDRKGEFKSRTDTGQNRRRDKYLATQKERRRDLTLLARRLADHQDSSAIAFPENTTDSSQRTKRKRAETPSSPSSALPFSTLLPHQPEIIDASMGENGRVSKWFRTDDSELAKKSKSEKEEEKYCDQLMIPEDMLELPMDLSPDLWYVVPFPLGGQRCLVISSDGKTVARRPNGKEMRRFASMLPNGRSGKYVSVNSKQYCLLDCIFDPSTNVFWMMDLICWKGHMYDNCDSAFRFFWLRTKFAELEEETAEKLKKQKLKAEEIYDPHFSFRMMPVYDASVSGIQEAAKESNRLESLLFYHKQALYSTGATPLVVRLRIDQVDAMLNVYKEKK